MPIAVELQATLGDRGHKGVAKTAALRARFDARATRKPCLEEDIALALAQE